MDPETDPARIGIFPRRVSPILARAIGLSIEELDNDGGAMTRREKPESLELGFGNRL